MERDKVWDHCRLFRKTKCPFVLNGTVEYVFLSVKPMVFDPSVHAFKPFLNTMEGATTTVIIKVSASLSTSVLCKQV